MMQINRQKVVHVNYLMLIYLLVSFLSFVFKFSFFRIKYYKALHLYIINITVTTCFTNSISILQDKERLTIFFGRHWISNVFTQTRNLKLSFWMRSSRNICWFVNKLWDLYYCGLEWPPNWWFGWGNHVHWHRWRATNR